MKHKTALILEGGAKRGLYSAGVLDVFMQNNINAEVIIDSYCEYIISKQVKGVVSVLPDGLSQQQYLDRLSYMIRDHYAPLTIYTEADYRCGKAALSLLKKYCFSKRVYGNAQQDEAFRAYSAATEKMIDDELFRISAVHNNAIPVINAEKMFTIVANTLQLLTSVEIYHKGKEKERTAKGVKQVNTPAAPNMIIWERTDTALTDVIPYLDKTFQITENFDKSRNNPNAPRRIIGEWAEFNYLRTILQLTKMKLDDLGVF